MNVNTDILLCTGDTGDRKALVRERERKEGDCCEAAANNNFKEIFILNMTVVCSLNQHGC